MAKLISEGEKAREKIFAGVTKLKNPVAATCGPKGRNILLENAFGRVTVTKDGVSVANEIELEDPFENMGAQLVKEAAAKTNEAAGDGTTTATILAHAMMEAGNDRLAPGANPILIKKGMEDCVADIVAHLKKMAVEVKEVEDIEAIATISSQDPEVGKMIATILDEIDENGIVVIEDGNGLGLEKRLVEGMQFDAGYRSAAFVTNQEAQTVEIENCAVIVTDAKISDHEQFIEALEGLAVKKIKNVAIIADGIDGNALSVLVNNKLRGLLNCVAIAAPGNAEKKRELLKDIVAMTGGKFGSLEAGLPIEKFRAEHAGFCKKIVVTAGVTTIIEGKGKEEEIAERVKENQTFLSTLSSEYDITDCNKRIARMTGGIAIISVGAASEVAQQERKHRVEDALSAAKAASIEGILPGGGTALIRAGKLAGGIKAGVVRNKDEQNGYEIVLKAIQMPLKTIARNAGKSEKEVYDKVAAGEGNFGYNALTDTFGDLVAERVIDPLLVTRHALENAVSVASMYITLEGVIVKKPLDTQEKALAAMTGRV